MSDREFEELFQEALEELTADELMEILFSKNYYTEDFEE